MFSKQIRNKFTLRAQEMLDNFENKSQIGSLSELLYYIYSTEGSLGSNFLKFEGLEPEDVQKFHFSYLSDLKESKPEIEQEGRVVRATKKLLKRQLLLLLHLVIN